MQAIFVSYARADSEFALKLANALRAAHVNIWIDQLDLPAGARWDLAIEKALKDAAGLIVILSKSSISSNNVMDEVSYALDVGKDIFPILVEECNVPFRLRRLQFIDFTTGQEEGLSKLLTVLSQASATKSSDAETPVDSGIRVADTDKKRNIIGKIRKYRSLKWGGIGAFLGAVSLAISYIYSPLNTTRDHQTADELHNIRAWKVGSPHAGDIPDPTPPFELHRAAKKMGFDLTVEAFQAKGFAAKFFDAIEKNKEPDILVIDNYGIIDGITTPLGNFTGIGRSDDIRNSLIFVNDSMREFEGDRGGWEILISTSKNFQTAKSLALRQPRCSSESMVTLEENKKLISEELHKSAWRSASDLYDVSPGSYFGITVCGFWGNKNLSSLHLIVTFEGKKSIGSSNILLMMGRKDSTWDLLSQSNSVDIISELNKNCKLVDAPSDAPSPGDLKLLGPLDGSRSSRKSKPALKWEWSGDVSGIACYLIESEAEDKSRWFGTHFTLVSPQKAVEITAPFGVGMQPHRWRVWMIDKTGAVVRSTWSTIIFTD